MRLALPNPSDRTGDSIVDGTAERVRHPLAPRSAEEARTQPVENLDRPTGREPTSRDHPRIHARSEDVVPPLDQRSDLVCGCSRGRPQHQGRRKQGDRDPAHGDMMTDLSSERKDRRPAPVRDAPRLDAGPDRIS
jgi:hypothetical protein